MNSNSEPGATASTWASTLKSAVAWTFQPSNRTMAVFLIVGLVVASIELLKIPLVSGSFSELEHRNQDQFFEWRERLFGRSKRVVKAQRDIVIVRIDKESKRRLGLNTVNGCPYRLYTALLDRLSAAQAQVIALDVQLAGKPIGGVIDKDIETSPKETTLSEKQLFVARLAENNNVIVASRTAEAKTAIARQEEERSGALELPDSAIVTALARDRGAIGNAQVTFDDDDCVRRANLTFDQYRPSNVFYKSFALRVAEHSLGTEAVTEEGGAVYFKNRLFPRRYRINFAGAPRTFPMVPAWRALDWKRHQARHGLFAQDLNFDANAESTLQQNQYTGSNADRPGEAAETPDNPFMGKIALIGFFDEDLEKPSSSSSPQAGYLTPVGGTGQLMSDVELQANLIFNVINGDYLMEPQGWEYLLVIALVSLLFGRILSLCGQHVFIYAAILIGMTIVWMLATFAAFLFLHILLPSVVPNLAVAVPASIIVLADHYYVGRSERARRVRLFRSLAAKPLAQEIERKLLAELGLEGKRMTVTVLACQLTEFPKLIDGQTPEETLERLNTCLAIIMRTIGEHSGVVERIWNCGVVGLFGAPIAMALEDQAKRSIDCLVDVRERLQAVEGAESSINREAPFGFACGISTGEAICGTLNAKSRDSVLMQYGAIGPAVEMALDLQRLNTDYKTICIISQTTADLVVARAELREIDRQGVGIDREEQSIYEFLSSRGALPAAFEEAMAIFQQARQAFEDGRIRAAEELFTTVNEMVPGDKPTLIMLGRCREFLKTEQVKEK